MVLEEEEEEEETEEEQEQEDRAECMVEHSQHRMQVLITDTCLNEVMNASHSVLDVFPLDLFFVKHVRIIVPSISDHSAWHYPFHLDSALGDYSKCHYHFYSPDEDLPSLG